MSSGFHVPKIIKISLFFTELHTHTQPFNGLWSRTTRSAITINFHWVVQNIKMLSLLSKTVYESQLLQYMARLETIRNHRDLKVPTTLNYADTFSIWQRLLRNANKKSHSRKWISSNLSHTLCLTYIKQITCSIMSSNSTPQLEDVCLLEVYASQYYKICYIYIAQICITSQSANSV